MRTGGISAFAVDLVKLGHEVESLPVEGVITFGDGGNPQDLSGYDVLVLPEPNQPFTASETAAIHDFVAAGGGLFLITDHQTSDRDCDGFDSPHIGNDLMGVVISGGTITDYGLFGIAFNVAEITGLTDTDVMRIDAGALEADVALKARGAYLAEDRLKNRAPLSKSSAEISTYERTRARVLSS